MSAISGMSGPQSAGLNVPKEGTEGRRITPSPTPPSPAYTPEREQSPPPPDYTVDDKAMEAGLDGGADHDRGRTLSGHSQRGGSLGDDIRTTTVNRGSSSDLYNASPRLPANGNGYAGSSHLERKFVEVPRPSNVSQTSGSENASMLAKAKSKSENKASDSGSGVNERGQGERARDEREEKIYYDAETGREGSHVDDGEGVAMSATSYPGQE